ncbi:MAG: mandelate racemase [Dehalococcoidia bacterium]|nr:MAG: mandelate racemase [Dehalococcoidia bacterium]
MSKPGDVRVAAVDVFVVDLPAKAVFQLAGGLMSSPEAPTPRVLTRVTGENGLVGWGESTPCPSWSYETTESIYTTLVKYLAPCAIGRPVWDLDGLHRAMDRAIMPGISTGQPIAKAGLDLAFYDLLGKTLGLSISQLLGGKQRDQIALGWIISSDRPDVGAELARQGLDAGYDAFKVKIGIHGERGDYEMVAAVRQVIGPDRFLWVDANQGYVADQALRMARRLEALGVAAFEQPLPANDLVGMKRLMDATTIPIALDEAVRSPSDLALYVRLNAVEVAIVKVQRSAGLWGARQFGEIAEASGVRLMGSGLTDSDVGLAASLHLYARFGIDTPVDLNGRQFVESCYVGAQTVRVEGGTAYVPEGPGLGVEVDEEKVAFYRRPLPAW